MTDSEKTYSQLVMELSEIRDRKPHTLRQMFGGVPSERQQERHESMMKAWRSEYGKKSRELKKAAKDGRK